jgi:HEAT repeat protein
MSAAGALSCYGQEARMAAPALFRATQDTDVGVRLSAFWALGDIRPDPLLAIPVLVAGLDDPFWPARANVARALQNYGPDAKAAVPALIKLVAASHSAGIEGDPFSDALKAIDPEAAAKAGVK